MLLHWNVKATVTRLHRRADVPVDVESILTKIVTAAAKYPKSYNIAFATAGGIDELVHIMRRHPTNASIQVLGCAVLRSLSFQNDDNKMTMTSLDSIQLTVSAMNQHSSNTSVQHHACALLCSLASNHVNKVTIANHGGIHAIIHAMQQQQQQQQQHQEQTLHQELQEEYPTHLSPFLATSLEEWACAALGNLSIKQDDNTILIAELGGIELIINAMKRPHASNVYSLQVLACGALCSLACDNHVNKVNIARLGGLELIMDAMQRWPSEEAIQDQGCRALCSLAMSRRNRTTMAELNGIELIIATMKGHSNSEVIQEWACAVLCNLAANENHRVTIGNQGGVNLIVSAIRRYPSNAGVLSHAYTALHNLSATAKNRSMMEALGGGELLAAIKNFEKFGPTTLPTGNTTQDDAMTVLQTLALNKCFDNDVKKDDSHLDNELKGWRGWVSRSVRRYRKNKTMPL